jgi:hypothetical protein
VFRGEITLQRRNIDEVLGQVGAEVLHLEWADDGVDAGEFEAVGGQVDLLHLNGCVASDGGQQSLELFELLAVRAPRGGGLQDESEVLPQAARDGVVHREVEYRVRRLARDQRSAECALGGRGQIHAARRRQLLQRALGGLGLHGRCGSRAARLRVACGGAKQQRNEQQGTGSAGRKDPPARRHCIPLNHCFYVTCTWGATERLAHPLLVSIALRSPSVLRDELFASKIFDEARMHLPLRSRYTLYAIKMVDMRRA